VFQAACRQYGVIVVYDLYDLVMTAEVFNYLRGKIHGRFQAALVTQSGGMGSLAADLCIQAGMTLQPLSPAVRQGLLSLPYLFHFGDFDNPVDVRAAGLRGPQTVQTLQPFLDDEQTDGLLLLLAKQLARAEDLETAEAMIFSAKSTSKPLMVVWMGPHKPEIDHPRLASDLLLEHGIPTFEQPGDCTRAIGRYLDYLHFRQSWLADPDNQDVDDEPGSITLPSVS
jgi:acyl-CoA synthetase (NDP forming)